ncbi:uncharacterized protein LOC118412795 [Branchiostoma floridae]|uniref:Uncharacterized protein LOC118412795 n=2 Tax=Branchiostoma floridae TaxID=7739 RepID=A0A9J7KXQ0_BRAFL|nr:uncharacterized protein LOC118412795 [Branchiostoma floridae]
MASGQNGDTGVRKYFNVVVDLVKHDWQQLGHHLGVKYSDITTIEKNRLGDATAGCRDVLEKWVGIKGKAATLSVLKQALIDSKHKDAADELPDPHPLQHHLAANTTQQMPVLSIITDIFVKVEERVETAKDIRKFGKAQKRIIRSTQYRLTDQTIRLIKKLKDQIKTVDDLLNLSKGVRDIQEVYGIKVHNVEKGSVIFNVGCFDLNSLGKLWFEHRNGKLAITLRESMLTKEIIQLMGDDIFIETTIDPDHWKWSLDYLIRGGHTGAPAEHPVFTTRRQPITMATTPLDALHLSTNKLHSTMRAMKQLSPIWQVAWQKARENKDLERKLKDQTHKAMETREVQGDRTTTSLQQLSPAQQPGETRQKDIKEHESSAVPTSTQQQTSVLLLGCKGNGKSHTGNIILGREAFRVTRKGGTGKSSLCSSSYLQEDGVTREVTVVDTPGVSQEMTESEFEELVRAVKMVPEGFNSICLVWDYNNSERNEDKEVQVFQSLHRLFGDGLYKHLIILVTHAQQEDIPEFIKGLPVNMKQIADKAKTVIAIDNRRKGETSCQLLLFPTSDTKYTSSNLSKECQIPPNADLHMVLIGKTGVGKSSTGNSIIGEDVFKVATVAATVTTKCNFHIRTLKDVGSKLAILDTPGLFATVNKEEIQKISEELCKIPTVFHDGIHALILVISGMSRFTEEDDNALKNIQRVFGEGFLDHTVVLITGKDSLKSSKEEYLASAPQTLSDILKKCQERCIFFDNVTMDATVRRKQLAKLITMAQEAVKRRKGPYTGQGPNETLFLEGAKVIDWIITKLFKVMAKDVQGPKEFVREEVENPTPKHANFLRSESLVDRARQYAASNEHEYYETSIAKSLFQTIQRIFLL